MIDLTLRHVVALLADRFRYFNPLIVSYRPTLTISQGLLQKVTRHVLVDLILRLQNTFC